MRLAFKRSLVPSILAGLFSLSGQSAAQVPNRLEIAAEQRIRMLDHKFDELLDDSPSERDLLAACQLDCTPEVQKRLRIAEDARNAAMNEVASQIHNEVDSFVVRTLDVKAHRLNSDGVAEGLRRILGAATYGSASVFPFSSATRSLIVAYTLRKGGAHGMGATSVTLRAYRSTDRAVALADATGDNMDGYLDVSTMELHSPVPNERWLLVSGYMSGANGPNNRMRIYAYDGTQFRPIWMPEDVWGQFAVQITPQGFTITGDYYLESRRRRDSYLLYPGGLTLVPR